MGRSATFQMSPDGDTIGPSQARSIARTFYLFLCAFDARRKRAITSNPPADTSRTVFSRVSLAITNSGAAC